MLAATPAMIPFTVEPKMMPAIIGRAAGVNHAVPPSTAPSNAPSRSPSTILFIASFLPARRICGPLGSLTTSPGFPLPLVSGIEQQQRPHDQIRRDQQDGGLIAAIETLRPLPQVLSVGGGRQAVDKAGNV